MAEQTPYTRRRRCEPRWASARHYSRGDASAYIRDWLLDPASLTRRLQLACGDRFRVRVLRQSWGPPLLSERCALAIKHNRRALIREVSLMCGDTPWVFARTVIPLRTLRGAQRRLSRLGCKSLGATLFADPGLRRGAMEVARLAPGDALYGHAEQVWTDSTVWGRRSLFWLQGKPLLVSEFFLPALLQGCGGE